MCIRDRDNVEFFVGKAEEVLPEQYEKNHIKADVIVVDPVSYTHLDVYKRQQHVLIKHAEKSAGHVRAVSRRCGVKTIDGGADVGGRRCLRNDAAFLVDDPGLGL